MAKSPAPAHRRLDFRQPRRRSLLFVEQRLARVHQLSLAVEFHRLVVVALASNDDQLARLKTDLESPRINAGIRGDTAVITSDNGVRSFQVSTPFPSGQMPWYMMAVWYASQHSGFLAVLGLIATSIMGLALTAMFKRHARKRLGSGDNQ